jgi:hypothetical protein
VLELDGGQRRKLGGVLRRRPYRELWHSAGDGAVHERCTLAAPATGSRLRRRSCAPAPSSLPFVPWLRLPLASR